MKKSKKIAIAGILSALCVITLFLGSVFQTLDLSAAAIASIIVLFAYIELGSGWAWGVYAAASILSLLLLPYKTAAAVFALFSGFYPIVKTPLNKISPMWLSIITRLICFNAILTVLIYISNNLLSAEDEIFGFGVLIYALGNITFLLYDLSLERLSIYYVDKIRPRLFRRYY